MKIKQIIILLLIIALSITACQSGSSDDAVSSQPNQAPETAQLMIGIIMLDQTEMSIMPEQAGEMLSYWQLIQSMISSGTSTQSEIDAVIKQIQSILTEDQLAYINGMDEIDTTNIRALFEELGIDFGPGRGGDDESIEGQMPAGAGQDGGIPGQGRGGGQGGGIPGQGPSAGGEISPEIQQTMEARQAANGGINNMLLNTIIRYLEAKIQ